MVDKVELGILGPLMVRAGGHEVVITGGPERDLLARLLVDANRPVPWNRLADDLGPLVGPATSARLGDLLGPGRVSAEEQGPLLLVRPGELDAARFDALTERALRLALDPGELAAVLDDAERLWRGPALAGFADRPWARPLARHLDRRRLDAAADRLDALVRSDRPQQAAHDARTLVVRFPREPRLWSLLVLAQDRSGRHTQALRTLRRARRVLGDGDSPAIAAALALDHLEQTLLGRRSAASP